MTTDPRHIIIVAMRRSGTTTLWRLLRQDPTYTCYDEPFGRLLADLPAEHTKRVRAEFIARFNQDPELFRAKFAPILRGGETTRGLTQEQADYLSWLISKGPSVADVTRCMGKIPDLHKIAPEAVMVHLYRHPAAFVTSHLLPSDRKDFMGLRRAWNERTFFTRTKGFNGWGMEELTLTSHAATTQALLSEVDVALPPATQSVPAIQRLLAIWLGAFRLAQKEGAALYADRFVEISFEALCSDPAAQLDAIYTPTGYTRPDINLSDLHPAAPGFAVTDARWQGLAQAAGFSKSELARFFPSPTEAAQTP